MRSSLLIQRELASTRFERILGNASQLSLVFVGCIVALLAVRFAEYILAPVFLAIIVGLMSGPIAGLMERRGVPSALSAAVVVVVLIGAIAGGAFAFSAPLSSWVARMPSIWVKLQSQLSSWREPLAALSAVQAQLQSVLGGDAAMAVKVADGGPITDLAFLAPAALGQVVIFLGGLYFFVAARESIRVGILSLCFTRKVRWRAAHIFRDVELRVSRYLVTITLVNLALASLVTLAMWAVGMPSPLLWGGLTFVFNYVPFLGQATMLALAFLIGLGTRDSLAAALVPAGCYWVLSFIESQLVTPNLLGRTMTINPFLIFLSLTFWLWAWGPVGGLVAVPSLLILHSVVTHIVPVRPPVKTRRLRAGPSPATAPAATQKSRQRERKASVATAAP